MILTARSAICDLLRVNGLSLDEVFPIDVYHDEAYHKVDVDTGLIPTELH